MPIKLSVITNQFVAAIKKAQEPGRDGDIVYGWDDDSVTLIIGAYRGCDDAFDPKTGELIKHRHKIMVMSWPDQSVLSFDNAVAVPMNVRPQVITPDGTGKLTAVNNDCITVLLDTGMYATYNDNHVQLFDWDRINATKTSND